MCVHQCTCGKWQAFKRAFCYCFCHHLQFLVAVIISPESEGGENSPCSVQENVKKIVFNLVWVCDDVGMTLFRHHKTSFTWIRLHKKNVFVLRDGHCVMTWTRDMAEKQQQQLIFYNNGFYDPESSSSLCREGWHFTSKIERGWACWLTCCVQVGFIPTVRRSRGVAGVASDVLHSFSSLTPVNLTH